MTTSFIIQCVGWQAKRGFGATCPKSTFIRPIVMPAHG